MKAMRMNYLQIIIDFEHPSNQGEKGNVIGLHNAAYSVEKTKSKETHFSLILNSLFSPALLEYIWQIESDLKSTK